MLQCGKLQQTVASPQNHTMRMEHRICLYIHYRLVAHTCANSGASYSTQVALRWGDGCAGSTDIVLERSNASRQVTVHHGI
jgi:hypothetical protein